VAMGLGEEMQGRGRGDAGVRDSSQMGEVYISIPAPPPWSVHHPSCPFRRHFPGRSDVQDIRSQQWIQ